VGLVVLRLWVWWGGLRVLGVLRVLRVLGV